MERDLPIIVYSNLRWNAVLQREQQLLSRITAQRDVYFFEETLAAGKSVPDSIELQYPHQSLVVIRPILERFSGPFDPDRIGPIAKRFLRWQRIEQHIAWVQTPLAHALAQSLSPELLVASEAELAAALEASSPAGAAMVAPAA